MKIKLFMTKKATGVHAEGLYDTDTKQFTVFAGSIVSGDVSQAPTFRGAKSILKAREGVLDGQKLIKDVHFKSSSTAGNFVTGRSTDGMSSWKDEQGRTLKEILR